MTLYRIFECDQIVHYRLPVGKYFTVNTGLIETQINRDETRWHKSGTNGLCGLNRIFWLDFVGRRLLWVKFLWENSSLIMIIKN